MQQSIPDRYRGRVFGSLGATGALLSLCGALTGGVLGGLIGIVPTLNIASSLVGLAGVVVLVVYARDRQPATVDRRSVLTRHAGERCSGSTRRAPPGRPRAGDVRSGPAAPR